MDIVSRGSLPAAVRGDFGSLNALRASVPGGSGSHGSVPSVSVRFAGFLTRTG